MKLQLEGVPAVSAMLLRGPDVIGSQTLSRFRRIGQTLLRKLQQDHLSGSGPTSLAARTGNTRRAAFYRLAIGGANEVGLVLGIDLAKAPGARAHNFGAHIHAHGQFLTIPIGRALTGKGVARFTAKNLIANPTAYGFLGTFVAKHVLFGKTRSGIVPLFILKESVTLRKVGMLQATIEGSEAFIQAELETMLRASIEVIERGGGG
jgi:hypothetical protein